MSLAHYVVRSGLYKWLQPLVHGLRRMRHPGVPVDQRVARVVSGSSVFQVRCRRWSGSDALAIEQCFVQKQYAFPVGVHAALVRDYYEAAIASGRKPLIVDCGANIGASALWFSSQFPEAHIIAVEPASPNFALLEINCGGRNIELRQAGIAAEDGCAWMLDEEGEMGCRIVSTQTAIPVAMVSVKNLLGDKSASEYVPFLLKIDIEGGEADLFAGDCTTINSFPLIVMEPHDWLFPGQGSSVSFFKFHADHGREFCMNAENVASLVPRDTFLQMTERLRNDATTQ